jgi:hypothetical protein
MEDCTVDRFITLVNELEELIVKNENKAEVRKNLIIYYIELRRINARGVYLVPENKDKLERAIRNAINDIEYLKEKSKINCE